MKKIMLLGGLRYLIPVIEAAHKQGYYVITADYLPDNIAHKYSDEYVNVSIIDRNAVLQEAKKRNIDGIISFAVDPGVLTAAYVQKEMKLPAFGPYESVEILQNKDKFRAFLTENGFNVPKAKGYNSKNDVFNDSNSFTYPIIVKPTDSAGSKGVSRVDSLEELDKALDYAFNNSIKGNIIIEDFIEQEGCASDSDSFSVNGEMKFITFSAQRFDKTAANPYTPSAYSWPCTYSNSQQQELKSELQRLISLLKMNTTVYNIETRIGKDGKPYIMEVSPRGGGNRLSEMIRYSTGVDFVTAAVRAAVGDSVEISPQELNGHWAEVILHADNSGKFVELKIADDFKKKNVFQIDLWVQKGDSVEAFNGANNSIGTLVLKFDSEEELEVVLNEQKKWFEVIVE